MELKDFYQEIGGDVQNVLGRFGGMEKMVTKFLGRFRDDTSFQKLEEAVASKDAQAIDNAAHTLKGVCSNLGIDKLQKQAEEIMLHVREGKSIEEVPAMFEAAKQEYTRVVQRLGELLDK